MPPIRFPLYHPVNEHCAITNPWVMLEPQAGIDFHVIL